MATAPTTAAEVDDLPCFRDLIAVLFECFLIISLGYLSANFKLISSQAKDLNSYLTIFALPVVVFLNIVQMDFQPINISFLACMLTAKLLVFILVTILTLVMSYPTNFGYAGSLSILATQSNDFALGYPLIKSLYEKKPETLSYLSLMVPIQLLILNPLGIIMLEFNKNRNKKRAKKKCDTCQLCNRASERPATSECAALNMNDTSNLAVLTSTPVAETAGDIRHRSATKNVGSSSFSPTITRSSQGFKHRNIKTLTLIIPSINRMDHVMESSSENEEQSILVYDPNESPKINQLINYSNPHETQTKCTHLATVGGNSPSTQPPPMFEETLPVSTIPRTSASNSANALSEDLPATGGCSCKKASRISMVDLSFLKSLATNPLIIASLLALVVNLTYGPDLPRFVTKVSNTIAASFAAPALFVVGVSMYGKFDLLLRNPSDLLLSSVLVLTKVLVLPNLMRTMVLLILPYFAPIEEVHYLVDFSFLYGLLPTAPTACIIANQYGILSNVVSISMLLSTFISAPLLLASSVIINPSTVIKVSLFENVISQSMKVSSIVTLALASLTLYAFWKSKKGKFHGSFIDIPQVASRSLKKIQQNPIHVFLFLLVFSQTIIGFGGLIWYFVDETKLETQAISSLTIRGTTTLQPNYLRQNYPETIEAPTQDPVLLVSSNLETLSTSSGADNWPNVDLQPAQQLHKPASVKDSTINTPLELAPEHHDISFIIFRTAQYVLSSFGLVMSKFVIFSLILTIMVMKLKGQVAASKVSAVMVRSYLVFGTFVIVWLIFDSRELVLSSTEASLPSKTLALYLRFIYDVIFILTSVPMFALLIKFHNKAKRRQQKVVDTKIGDTVTGGALARRRNFVTSSSSLSSDTSSAVTANTNLESTNVSNSAQTIYDACHVNESNNINSNSQNGDSFSVVLDASNLESIKRPNGPSANNHSEPTTESDQNQPFELNDPTICNDTSSSTNSSPGNSSISKEIEFNKCSMLIVFIITDALHNLTTISQKLLQDEPYGTFRQIEVVNVAMEFGQGLITFLIYRMRGLLS